MTVESLRAREEPASGLTERLRIVSIEDNEDLAESLKDFLEETGHRVWSANSGSVGVRRVEEVNPNVVLCDLGMSQMGGLEVCRRIRASHRHSAAHGGHDRLGT